jgi:hypothetical protein
LRGLAEFFRLNLGAGLCELKPLHDDPIALLQAGAHQPSVADCAIGFQDA